MRCGSPYGESTVSQLGGMRDAGFELVVKHLPVVPDHLLDAAEPAV